MFPYKQTDTINIYMKNLIILLIFGCIIDVCGQAQNPKTEISVLEAGLRQVHGKQKIESYNRLAELYLNVFNQKSIQYARAALDSIRKYRLDVDQLIKANLYSTIGAAYYNIKEYKMSAEYFDKEYELIKDMAGDENVFLSLFNLGTIYNKLNSNKKSVKYYLRSLSLAEKANKGDLVLQNYQALYEVYEAINDHENSLRYYKLYNNLRDSLLITEAKKEITILKSKYSVALKQKKEKEIELRGKEQQLTVAEIKKQKLEQDSAINAQKIALLNEINRYNQMEIQLREIKIKKEQEIVRSQRRVIYLLVVLFTVIFLFSVLLYREYRAKKRAVAQMKSDKTIIDRHNEESRIKNMKIEQQNLELLELNSVKDRFFSIIAHDLRNPFNQIIGLSELIISKYENYDEKQINEMIAEIYKTSVHTYRLLENLLEWSRSQSGNIIFNPEKLPLAALVNEQIAALHTQGSIKSIELIHDIQNNILVYADKNMLNTILRNLITNAIKFSHPGGIVHISAERTAQHLKISVADQGIGINEENLKRLFTLDSNFSTKGTAGEKGTGLGLILCREFTARHGGEISVTSIEGQGSTFTCKLPYPIQE